MPPCDDIGSVSTAFAQPVLQQPRDGQVWFGISLWWGGEAQSSTAPALQLPGRSSTSLTSPNTFWNYPPVCTGWHLKNHQLLMEIVKRCSGEDVLFCSLPYPSCWQRKNNACSRSMEWLVFRNIFDHKIKSNHSFEKRSSQTTDYCTGHRRSYTVTTHFYVCVNFHPERIIEVIMCSFPYSVSSLLLGGQVCHMKNPHGNSTPPVLGQCQHWGQTVLPLWYS